MDQPPPNGPGGSNETSRGYVRGRRTKHNSRPILDSRQAPIAWPPVSRDPASVDRRPIVPCPIGANSPDLTDTEPLKLRSVSAPFAENTNVASDAESEAVVWKSKGKSKALQVRPCLPVPSKPTTGLSSATAALPWPFNNNEGRTISSSSLSSNPTLPFSEALVWKGNGKAKVLPPPFLPPSFKTSMNDGTVAAALPPSFNSNVPFPASFNGNDSRTTDPSSFNSNPTLPSSQAAVGKGKREEKPERLLSFLPSSFKPFNGDGNANPVSASFNSDKGDGALSSQAVVWKGKGKGQTAQPISFLTSSFKSATFIDEDNAPSTLPSSFTSNDGAVALQSSFNSITTLPSSSRSTSSSTICPPNHNQSAALPTTNTTAYQALRSYVHTKDQERQQTKYNKKGKDIWGGQAAKDNDTIIVSNHPKPAFTAPASDALKWLLMGHDVRQTSNDQLLVAERKGAHTSTWDVVIDRRPRCQIFILLPTNSWGMMVFVQDVGTMTLAQAWNYLRYPQPDYRYAKDVKDHRGRKISFVTTTNAPVGDSWGGLVVNIDPPWSQEVLDMLPWDIANTVRGVPIRAYRPEAFMGLIR